jgi:hypothetical protein
MITLFRSLFRLESSFCAVPEALFILLGEGEGTGCNSFLDVEGELGTRAEMFMGVDHQAGSGVDRGKRVGLISA